MWAKRIVAEKRPIDTVPPDMVTVNARDISPGLIIRCGGDAENATVGLVIGYVVVMLAPFGVSWATPSPITPRRPRIGPSHTKWATYST